MHLSRLLWIVPALALTGCGSISTPSTPPPVVNVAYAGSLELINQQALGPAFTQTFHIGYQGRGGGSFGLAQELKSHTISADVFESIGMAPIEVVEPKTRAWAVAVASSPLVVAYNPHSRFAAELNAIRDHKAPLSQLFQLIMTPGFALGRTNPVTDPQGRAFCEMMELAVARYHLPSSDLTKLWGGTPTSSSQIYSEEGILTQLQSGGIDASSAFLSEALQRHLPYIALPPALNFADSAYANTYAGAHLAVNGKTVAGTPLYIDVTLPNIQPSAPAKKFLNFLLSPKGRALWHKMGYESVSPKVLGNPAAMPQGVDVNP